MSRLGDVWNGQSEGLPDLRQPGDYMSGPSQNFESKVVSMIDDVEKGGANEASRVLF